VKLSKLKSRFYQFDFTVLGRMFHFQVVDVIV
jgi:hypothetical protein